ncbi:MAG TPA: response regulator [Verrucomicrobiae bacterium]|nr:response regulator [Verrucomicrobiae bacterium]
MAHKILVVDDEPYMLRFIQILLEREGYEMIKAGNGREAVEVAMRENPRLVVMDAMMPKMDGLTALRLLKQEPATRSIPVIMLTANPHKFSREEAESSGATIFLTKPFSPTQLLAEIRRHIPDLELAD